MDNLSIHGNVSYWNATDGQGSGAKDEILINVLNTLEYVNYIALPTFLMLGLIGNCLTIIILQTKKYSHLTSRIVLTCLACSDTALLLTQPFNKMAVLKLIGRDARALSNVGCKIFFIIFKSAKMTSSWCLVVLCVERFTAVWYPLKTKTICSKRNIVIALIAIYICNITFTSGWSYASQVVNGFCFHDFFDKTDPNEVLKFGVLVVIGCCLYSFIPSLIMLTLTPLIIFKLAKRRAVRKRMTGRSAVDGNRISAMLIGIVTAYLILVIPNTSLHLISYAQGLNAFGTNSAGFLIFRDVTQILEQLNYAINFFLYVVTSNQFRQGFVALLTCKTNAAMRDSFSKYSRSTKISETNNSRGDSRYSKGKDTPTQERKGHTNNGYEHDIKYTRESSREQIATSQSQEQLHGTDPE